MKTFSFGLGDEKVEAFLHPSLFDLRSVSSSFHSHPYTEIHITLRGHCVFYVRERVLPSEAGIMTALPANVEHRRCVVDPDTMHIAFLVDNPIPDVLQKACGSVLSEGLVEEVNRYRRTGEWYPVAVYLSFLCRDVIRPRIELRPVENREFLIREFFSNRYNEAVTLEDLANDLHLCTRQTARLVQEYLGESFSKALLRYRIEAAERLLKQNSSLSLAEAAQLVGYNSYTGFWKAVKRFEKERMQPDRKTCPL